MSVFIKICGLRDAEMVEEAVAAGADAVGFVFAESLRRVTPEEARLASQDVPDGVSKVAVMRHPSNDALQAVLEGFAPDVLQTDAGDFDGLEIPDDVARWPVFREGVDAGYAAPLDVFVYEGADSGTGETVDWLRAAEEASRGRMILAGGLSADNVAMALQTARPWGVDVSSGVEQKPGVKDAGLIREFIAAVRAAENY